MENDSLNIKIKFAENEFPLKVKRSQEKLYRDAANFIEKRIQLYRNKEPKKGMETHLSLISLELAVELLRERERKNSDRLKIEKLIGELEENAKGTF